MARPVMKTLSDVAAAMTDLSQETLSPTPLTMGEEGGPVSYTHLTLPTIYSV